ncbi:hypothetical protein BDZ97DRAFT_327682 [Flammula alnicola]|nr:hypothetical protein BDZ97DRAFT_327682 [Flammula alnicola]
MNSTISTWIPIPSLCGHLPDKKDLGRISCTTSTDTPTAPGKLSITGTSRARNCAIYLSQLPYKRKRRNCLSPRATMATQAQSHVSHPSGTFSADRWLSPPSFPKSHTTHCTTSGEGYIPFSQLFWPSSGVFRDALLAYVMQLSQSFDREFVRACTSKIRSHGTRWQTTTFFCLQTRRYGNIDGEGKKTDLPISDASVH